MRDLEKILKLGNYKIIKIEERCEKNKIIKVIYIESKNKKDNCPICNEYTSSIYDKLKLIEVKYLKIIEQDTKINILKEDLFAIGGAPVRCLIYSLVLKYLLNYNLSIKYISSINNIFPGSVRNILLNAMNEYLNYVKNLLMVISFN